MIQERTPYPPPGGAKPVVNENEHLISAGTRESWEEAIFRAATHFNVFRLHRRQAAGTFPQRESTAYNTFPEALADAERDPNALVYAVTALGSNFCVVRAEWPRYRRIWEER